jgi:hypothetical protein
MSGSIGTGESRSRQSWRNMIQRCLDPKHKSFGDGDPLAVAGEFDCQAYKTDAGEDSLSWSIMVDAVLSARAKPKPKAEQRAGREVAEASWAAP